MSPTKRVALLIETSNAYARGLLSGIHAYIREQRRWSIYVGEQRRGEAAPRWLHGWKGDGVIARIETRQIARAVKDCGLPAVDVSAGRLLPELPWVETHDEAIAEMAVAHLRECGLHELAYCGDRAFQWSINREQAFRRIAEELNCRVHLFEPASGKQDWEQEQRRIAEWVAALPKPVGLMACYDIRGRQVVDACRELGVAVPDEVAVIGVDNDELVCELADPPLSSIALDARGAGYAAAELLARMMEGERLPPAGHLFPPIAVVARQSTDVLALDDAELVRAVRYIRRHACEGIQVEDVLKEVPLSRRALEARFKSAIGRTLHEEMMSVRIARVKELLLETNLTLVQIADRAGFAYVEYMSVAFKKHVGASPSVFRRRGSGRGG